MNGITHKQAIQFIHRRLDGMLKGNDALLLDEHLDSCDVCRTYASEMDVIPAQLNAELKSRWDADQGPSLKVAQHVSAQARKIATQQRFASAIKLVTGLAAIAVLAFFMNFMISRLQSASVTANGTPFVSSAEPVGLLAFTSRQDGNSEIYIMHADGSGMVNLTNNPANDSFPFWSPDGSRIAFMSDRDGSTQIYLMDADGSNLIRLTEGEGDYGLDANGYSPWSPDGIKLIISHMRPGERTVQLYVLSITDKNLTLLTEQPGEYMLTSWSTDGRHIAFVSSEIGRAAADLYVVGSDGNGLVKLTETLLPGEYFSRDYEWSPDSSSIFFATHSNEQIYQKATYYSTVYRSTVDGVKEISAQVKDRQIINWWGNGEIRLELDERMMRWRRSDGSESHLELCEKSSDIKGIAFERSRAGNLVFGLNCFPDGWALYWIPPDATAADLLLDGIIPTRQDSVFGLTFSSDERHLAFVTLDSTSVDLAETLYIVDVAKAREDPSAQPLKLENSFGQDWQPISNREVVEEKPTPAPARTLSSNGLLAFVSGENGNSDVYTMRADGSDITNITNDSANDYSPVWSLDGKSIFFISERTGNTDIYSVDADGSHLTQLTDSSGFDGLFSLSPNGEKIIYLSSSDNDANMGSLAIMNADGSNKFKLTGPGSYIFLGWSPDGQKIVYQKQILETDGLQDNEIHISDIDGGNHYQWTAIIDEIKWEDEQHFAGYGWSGQSEPPTWNLYRFSSNGTPSLEIASHSSRIVALYDHTHLVEGASLLAWYDMDGDLTPLHSWDVQGDCKQRGDPYIQETSQAISADGNHVFITVYCGDGYLQFYLTNADGSELKQLTDFSVETSINYKGVWSLDGKFVMIPITNKDGITTDFYRFDIEEMLRDPSKQPVQVTTDGVTKYDIVWQPIRNSEAAQDEPVIQPTPTATNEEPPDVATNISNGEWIAFIGGKTIPDPANSLYMTTEQDVFLIHPDGSELVNITNSPDFYVWPQWSPNGNDLLFLRMRNSGTMDILRKNGSNGFDVLVSTSMSFDPSFHYSWSPNGEQIAFVDKSSGNLGIYTMYADGRNDPQITQLTDDPADDFGFVWSPDGDRIAFQRLAGDKLSIHVMNQDGSNPHEVAQGMGRVWLYWSHDGKVLYASGGSQLTAQSNWLECEGCSHNPAIYHMDPGGTSVEQIYAEPEYSQVGFHLYDTPQNTLYFMRVEPQPFLEFWGTWFRFDGTSVQQIDPLDPHQTCKTTDGNILSEDISSNQRFSIVTNFCAGGFDLYLVDRETPRPKLRHLLQLPLDTWGQGGNFAYLPITWSPDGRSIIYDDGHGSMLLLDLEKVMQDPSTQPVRFIQPVLYEGQSGQMFQSPESIFVIDLVWQPKP